MAFETLITILSIENLNSQRSLLPDNSEWHWTAFAILAMFRMYGSDFIPWGWLWWGFPANWNSSPKTSRLTRRGYSQWERYLIRRQSDKEPVLLFKLTKPSVMQGRERVTEFKKCRNRKNDKSLCLIQNRQWQGVERPFRCLYFDLHQLGTPSEKNGIQWEYFPN